jgi:hypothetical protein
MPDVFDLLTQLVGERPSALFASLLVVHILASPVTTPDPAHLGSGQPRPVPFRHGA